MMVLGILRACLVFQYSSPPRPPTAFPCPPTHVRVPYLNQPSARSSLRYRAEVLTNWCPVHCVRLLSDRATERRVMGSKTVCIPLCGTARIRCGTARIRCGTARIRCGTAPRVCIPLRCGTAHRAFSIIPSAARRRPGEAIFQPHRHAADGCASSNPPASRCRC